MKLEGNYFVLKLVDNRSIIKSTRFLDNMFHLYVFEVLEKQIGISRLRQKNLA